MNLSKHLIVINNEPKTLQIDSIKNNGSYGYSVRFKNGSKTYNYSYNKVQWLREPMWVDPTHNQVFAKGIIQKQIKEIWKFENDTDTYWRIIHNNGFIKEYIDLINILKYLT